MELLEQIANTQRFETVSDLFKQLENPSRLRIFWLLCHSERCVNDIATALEASSPAVSHHLRALKACGLIVSTRSGKEVYYRAASTRTAQALHLMVENVMQIACPDE